MTQLHNITKLCNKFNKTHTPEKHPAHFLQLNECKRRFSEIKVEPGKLGKTEIPESLMPTFITWLCPEYKQRVMDGEKWQAILEELKGEN